MRTLMIAAAVCAAGLAAPALAQSVPPMPSEALPAIEGDWYAQREKLHIKVQDGTVTVVGNDSETVPAATTVWKPGAIVATFTGLAAHEGTRVNFDGTYAAMGSSQRIDQNTCNRFFCYAYRASFGRDHQNVIALNVGGIVFWRREVLEGASWDSRK